MGGETLTQFWERAKAIWIDGGWGMAAIAASALVLFAMGLHVYLSLGEKNFRSVPENVWRQWLDRPGARRGHIGALLDFVVGNHTIKDMGEAFRELQIVEIGPFRRDLRVMKVCVSAAPLLGLLGTVTGMLATFGALASGSGGEQTMGKIADGIRVALITTETGLVVALPGLFFHSHLHRRFEAYTAFLAHLETVCTQHLYRRLRSRKAAS